ncbi:MAG: alpha-L-fucosidase, partial [Bacteroidota bacterium]
MRTIILLLTPLLFFACQDEPQEDLLYQSDWESLKKHETPEWFLNAKFGIYCHWGPYSVPAFGGEWYSHWMYVNENNPEYPKGKATFDHHVREYDHLDQFGYKDFIPMFKAEKFNPAEWAELFKRSGAQFAGPVSEHADGFAMWDSQLTEWDAKDMGPKRDIMGELAHE